MKSRFYVSRRQNQQSGLQSFPTPTIQMIGEFSGESIVLAVGFQMCGLGIIPDPTQ